MAGRLQQAQRRIQAAWERVQALEDVVAGITVALNDDPDGRGWVKESILQYRRLQMAKAALLSAEQALENLREEARRAGVPPGWLR